MKPMKKAETTFIKLPHDLQREIKGGCQCPYCKAHPHQVPKWDTLGFDGTDSWTVHMPELKNGLYRYIKD